MIERTFIAQLIDKLVNAERAAEYATALDVPAQRRAAHARRDLDDAIDVLHEQAWKYEGLSK